MQTRRVDALGFGEWSVALDPAGGVLTYDVREWVPGGRGFYMIARYTRNQAKWSILGFDSVELHLSEVSGMGNLEVSVTTSDLTKVVQVSIEEPGILIYPLSNLAAEEDLNESMFFRFIPESDGFKVSISEIVLVPEVSTSILLAVGLLWLNVQRRRV